MRETEANRGVVHAKTAMRALRLSAMALGLTLAVASLSSAAYAQDDEDESLSFDKRIMKSLIEGIGGTNMDNRGIEYRERSPLVVPPKLDLPPPDTATQALAPNWPTDPDVARRRADAAAERDAITVDPREYGRTLTPAEMAPKRVKRATIADKNDRPGDPIKNPMLSPQQLGYSGGLMKNMFGGGNVAETATFKGEPTRGELTQPPPGYQTPSSNFAYGTGPREVMQNSTNINPMTGKYQQ